MVYNIIHMITNKKTILVTGGSGLVGNAIKHIGISDAILFNL